MIVLVLYRKGGFASPRYVAAALLEFSPLYAVDSLVLFHQIVPIVLARRSQSRFFGLSLSTLLKRRLWNELSKSSS